MGTVPAHKKGLTDATRERLEAARAKWASAEAEMWAISAAALSEGTHDEIAAIIGVARSTLQEKVRKLR